MFAPIGQNPGQLHVPTKARVCVWRGNDGAESGDIFIGCPQRIVESTRAKNTYLNPDDFSEAAPVS